MVTDDRRRAQSSVRLDPAARREARPDPNDVRAVCPYCGSDVVSGVYYLNGSGFVIWWDCWEALGDAPTCTYRRPL